MARQRGSGLPPASGLPADDPPSGTFPISRVGRRTVCVALLLTVSIIVVGTLFASRHRALGWKPATRKPPRGSLHYDRVPPTTTRRRSRPQTSLPSEPSLASTSADQLLRTSESEAQKSIVSSTEEKSAVIRTCGVVSDDEPPFRRATREDFAASLNRSLFAPLADALVEQLRGYKRRVARKLTALRLTLWKPIVQGSVDVKACLSVSPECGVLMRREHSSSELLTDPPSLDGTPAGPLNVNRGGIDLFYNAGSARSLFFSLMSDDAAAASVAAVAPVEGSHPDDRLAWVAANDVDSFLFKKCCVEHQAMQAALQGVMTRLRAFNVSSAWLTAGTLLGAVREKGRMIPWDTDVDVLISAADEGRARLALRSSRQGSKNRNLAEVSVANRRVRSVVSGSSPPRCVPDVMVAPRSSGKSTSSCCEVDGSSGSRKEGRDEDVARCFSQDIAEVREHAHGRMIGVMYGTTQFRHDEASRVELWVASESKKMQQAAITYPLRPCWLFGGLSSTPHVATMCPGRWRDVLVRGYGPQWCVPCKHPDRQNCKT